MSTGAAAVEHKDVVLGLLGVSAGLAGLLLVFLGLVVTTFQSFDGSTPASVLNRYRWAAALVLAAFAIGMACVAVAVAWLLRLGRSEAVYLTTVWLFGTQVVTLLVATAWTAWRLVWGK